MKVTRLQLAAIMPNAGSRIDTYLPIINGWAEYFNINTKSRIAHYLAQIAHESGELRYTRELASGRAYEGRKDLGNTKQGDGVKFKGRGLIQITGRANYHNYSAFCGFDVESNPELLERPLGATKSSMWIFDKFGCNQLADADSLVLIKTKEGYKLADSTTLKKIRKKINGGYNGLSACEKYLIRTIRALEM